MTPERLRYLLSRPQKPTKTGLMPRPKLPNAAERLYLGALRRYSETLIGRMRETLVLHGIRVDAKIPDGVYADIEGIPFESVGLDVLRHQKRETKRVLGLLDRDIAAEYLLLEWRTANVALVTGFTQAMWDQLSALIASSRGARVEDIAQQIQKTFDMTTARAELIARDQTLKLNAQIQRHACKAAGIEWYRWSTSQDSSVREWHDRLKDQYFRFDDPPIVSERGDRGNPGDDYQCRCVPIPYIPEIEGALAPHPASAT